MARKVGRCGPFALLLYLIPSLVTPLNLAQLSHLLFWNRSAAKRPLLTLALTNGVMGATGDILAQYISPPPPAAADAKKTFSSQYNPWRTARFFAYGCMFAPVAHRWYSLLDRRLPFPAKAAASSSAQRGPTSAAMLLTACKRVVADQTVFAPAAIAAFFTVMGVMEGKGPSEIGASLRERYPEALVGNYVLWPAAQLINFSLVPLIYRVPFSSLVEACEVLEADY
ncbi:hypothetical protein GQ54DRAFT_304350 [Martensiomyces pterosporus]|nr:hypothetical protein GQ54DRAFT_304350 [Martensiomyces pterosporus]